MNWSRPPRLRLVAGASAAIAVVATFTVMPWTAAAAPAQPAWRVTTLTPPPVGQSSFAEPGIAIAADGTAIANAATANTGAPPTAWLSRDGGSSWTPGLDFDHTGASTGDADAAIAADGSLYALNLGYDPNPPGQPTNPTVAVFRSRDGVSWQGPASFPPPHGLDQPDRPWLLVDPRDPAAVDVVNSEGGGNIVMWRSHDHGASFTGPIPVTGGANGQAALALSTRPLVDPSDDRRIFMLYETVTAAGLAATLSAGQPVYEFPMTQLWLAASDDAGLTWSNHAVLDTAALTGSTVHDGTLGHLLVASAVDPQGNLYAAFALRPSGATRTDVHLIHSTDHGVTWSAPARVADGMPSNVMPALAVGPSGSAYLSWYGSNDPDFRHATATWFEIFAMSTDPLAAQPSFLTSRLTTSPVHVGGIDTAGAIGSDLGADWGLRDFQSLAVDGCGRPHPVWAVDRGRPATQTAVPLTPCPSRRTSLSQASPGGSPNTAPAPLAAAATLLASCAVGCLGLVRPRRSRRRRPRAALRARL